MGAASFLQTSFLGGEWSPYGQGRMDRQDYRAAMNVSFNMLPVEEGAHTRRPGTRYIAPTRKGAAGTLREFHFSQGHSYNLEFTTGHMRFVSGTQLVLESSQQLVLAISTATPAVIRTGGKHGWATGDEVQFQLPDGVTASGAQALMGRQFELTVLSLTSFSIHDPVTGAAFDGSTIDLTGLTLSVARVLDFPTAYADADWPTVRVVQSEKELLICQGSHAPYVLESLTSENSANKDFATFSLNLANFLDGPYFDPAEDGSTMTPSGKQGIITLTVGFTSWDSGAVYAIDDSVAFGGAGYVSLSDNNFNNEPDTNPSFWRLADAGGSIGTKGFVSTDVGRMIRLFSEPAAYDPLHAYAKGDNVKFNDAYWTALKAATGKQPDLDAVTWSINPTGGVWTWGRITAIITSVEVDFQLIGGPLLYTTPIKTYRLGLYSDTTGWPTGGTFQGGRFWLFGAQGNRIDSSMSNKPLTFSPTGPDGTVADNNAISAVMEADDINTIFWASADHQGIFLGTQGGEWLLQASALNDPLTPTSIQANRVTKYGAANIEPRRTGLSLVVAHRFQRKLLEFVTDAYSGKYSATNLALMAKHLTAPGIAEIAYQQELAPIVWARMEDGSLKGMTYKRESPFGTQPASFSGWHRHSLGSGRTVEAIQSGPSSDGNTDSVTLITAGVTGPRHIELLTSLFDEDTDITQSWFVDDARPPITADYITGTPNKVRLYGYQHLAGQTVQVWGAGLDLGDFLVAADGTIDIPIGSANGLFTDAYLATLTAQGGFGDVGVFVNKPPTGTVPDPFAHGVFEYAPTLPTVTGNSTTVALPDFDNNRAFFIKAGNGSSDGVRAFNLATGAQQAEKAAATLPSGSQFVTSPMVLGGDGNLYFYSSSSNRGILRKLNGNGLSLLGSFGQDSASFPTTGGLTPGLASPYSMCPMTVATHFIVSAAALFGPLGGAELAVINTDTMAYTGFRVLLDEDRATVTRGPNFIRGAYKAGTVYALGRHETSLGNSTKSLGLYSLTIDERAAASTDGTGIGSDSIAKITPHQIDATWTHFSTVYGLAYDGTDGNVIAAAHIQNPANWSSGGSYVAHDAVIASDTNVWGALLPSTAADPITLWAVGTTYALNAIIKATDGHWYQSKANGNVGNQPAAGASPGSWTDLGILWELRGAPSYTHTDYFVKISVLDGSILWAVPVNAIAGSSDQNLNMTRIRNGRFAYLSPTPVSTVYQYYTINTKLGTSVTTPLHGVALTGGQVWDDVTGRFTAYIEYTTGGSAPPPVAPTVGSFTDDWASFPGAGGITPTTPLFAPFVAGYTYTSQGQILRPIAPQETGAQNGPALGKTRRIQQFTALLHRTQGISFGGDLNNLRPANFETPGGTPYTVLQLYSGAWWDTLDDDSSFDGMTAWQVVRPYPATVLAIESFLHTQDR